MKFLIIADDLTGALDSSGVFATHGLTVLCATSPRLLNEALERGPDVVSVSTNSRELSEAEAVRRMARVLSVIGAHNAYGDALIFKKVDSRLKGHVAAEIVDLAAGSGRTLICPAVPKLGRFVRNGAVCGAGVAVPIAIAERTGCSSADIPDALSDADLDAAVRDCPPGTLFIGAAGLAEALARKHAASPSPREIGDLPAPALFAIGSRDPVTLAQLGGLATVRAPNGNVPANLPTGHDRLQVVQMTADGGHVDPLEAGEKFASGICKLLHRRQPALLLACGGETAAAIMRGVGCGLLLVKGEVSPGLPMSQMLDGLPGLNLITKSGGFGPPEILLGLADRLVARAVEHTEEA
ncbi:MAG: hypothetical protein KDJ29_18240 [Hyphomicrobiales bacterium]|nr:hypothetical protein [Nitratireductor sp.]MCC2098837.1 hypothetical protein [Hyphomicrobiales bacterium]